MNTDTIATIRLLCCSIAVSAVATCSWAAAPGPVPGPHKVTVEQNVFVPMRDGVGLATDLYFPEEIRGGPLPTVLIRTPYDKTHGIPPKPEVEFFASHGYAVAVQDVRGAHRSGGDYRPSGSDDVDGYDTIEWLARQSWSNGRVGMYGCSYLGDVQIFAAATRPPSLKAIIPQASGSAIGSAGGAYRQFGVRVGGAVEWAAAIGWFSAHGYKEAPRLPDTLPRDEYNRLAARWPPPTPFPIDTHEAWWHLPMIDALASQGAPPTEFENSISHAPADPYWNAFPYLTDDYEPDVPALFINSWYDFGADMTLYEFMRGRDRSRSELARANQFVVMSPHTHCASEEAASENAVIGARPVGNTQFDYFGLYLAWFDHWLKNTDNDVLRMPAVQYYAMGANTWRSSTAWPIPGSRTQDWYLGAERAANSLFGGGYLSPAPPTGSTAVDAYEYDPMNPVPSLGGAMCCTGSADALPGSVDQRSVEARHDVLVYTTAALENDVDATGPASVTLYVDSSAPDTDFTAKLVDVGPDGSAYNVLEGILRARYRRGMANAVPLDPGKVEEITIPLGVTSNVFLKGHRIRLEISSSNFPRFDRNLNTGGINATETRWRVATNRVHHTPRWASRLTLTVVP